MSANRRPCLDCGGLCLGTRCPACQRARDRGRPGSAERRYDAAWRRLRAEHLTLEPWCRCGCGLPATDVDHILARAAGGSDDHANLQSLTHGHHSRKTALADGGFGHPAAGWSASPPGAEAGRGTVTGVTAVTALGPPSDNAGPCPLGSGPARDGSGSLPGKALSRMPVTMA